MIDCKDCEYCTVDKMGRMQFRCNPFQNIREPECLQKWTLLKMDMLLRSYQSMLKFYNKFAPMQEKMMKYLEREIDEMQETDQWKYDDDDEDETDTGKGFYDGFEPPKGN